MMVSTPAPPAYIWPHKPFWGLRGFEFTNLRRPDYRTRFSGALYKREFTSPELLSTATSVVENYSLRVCNNVAVQFRAMLYCKDSYTTPFFWDRVHQCSHHSGAIIAREIAEIFVAARKLYLLSRVQSPRSRVAQLVDEWITFLESNPPPQPAALVPWHIRYRSWVVMKDRGELIDAGQPRILRERAARNARGVERQPAQGPPPSRLGNRPTGPDPVIKQDVDTPDDISDDISVIELATPRGSVTEPRKRKRSESPSIRLAKRRADQATRNANFSPIVLSSSPVAKQDESPISTQKKRNSTKTRVTECEHQLAEHIDLINAQDAKITAHEAKIEGLDSRLKSVEGREPQDAAIQEIQKSITDVNERLNSRALYMRTEIKKQWNEYYPTITRDQDQVTSRLDQLNERLTVQNVRLEDCQKAVEKQAKELKDMEEEGLGPIVSSLKKKTRKLSDRIDELEEKFGRDNSDTLPVLDEDQNMRADGTSSARSRLEALWAALTERVTKLEEMATEYQQNQASVNAEILSRLETLESSSASRRTSFDLQVAPRGARFMRQVPTIQAPSRDRRSQHHHQVGNNQGQSPQNGRWSSSH